MTSEDTVNFLAGGNLTVLFALRADGYPTAWPMMTELVDGALTMSTYAKSAKARHVANSRNDVACVVLERAGGSVVRALSVIGPMSVREAGPEGPRGRTRRDRPAASVIDVPDEVVDRVTRREQSGQRVLLEMPLTESTQDWILVEEGDSGAEG